MAFSQLLPLTLQRLHFPKHPGEGNERGKDPGSRHRLNHRCPRRHPPLHWVFPAVGDRNTGVRQAGGSPPGDNYPRADADDHQQQSPRWQMLQSASSLLQGVRLFIKGRQRTPRWGRLSRRSYAQSTTWHTSLNRLGRMSRWAILRSVAP